MMNPKVVESYKTIGKVLKAYKSGKLPKLFKAIPLLSNWEDILFLTKPEEWSPQSMFEATKIFVGNAEAVQTQRFLNLVLLPAVRDNISAHKKLNYHLYMSVKKAMFKPNALFKGFVLPLSKDASSREAAIIGSLLLKCSVSVQHASACLLKICEFPYSLGTNFFIKIFLSKNYAFPDRVIESLVDYFFQFTNESMVKFQDDQGEDFQMPVLWHQSLLLFVQKYRHCLDDEQK